MSTEQSDALRELEAEVGVLIRRVRRVIGERARAVHPDLQGPAYLMLGYIRDHGPLRASAISAVFDVDKGAMSRQVQHMIDLGLVDREPDPADGRATLLTASAEAIRRLDAVTEDRRRMLQERLGDWSAEDLRELVVRLRRYNEALGGDLAPVPSGSAEPEGRVRRERAVAGQR